MALNIVGCVWLLWWTARAAPATPQPDDTSHVWDGDITEYNKPLPRWWINLFYLTIVFSIGYLAVVPGAGRVRRLQRLDLAGEHDADKASQDAKLDETFAPYDGQADRRARARPGSASTLGRSIFANTCATCHGSSAQGAIGYPNLTDDIWHWGGEPEQVLPACWTAAKA